MKNELIISGKQTFAGKEMPIVLGGFGEDKKCLSDKTIAEIHEMKLIHVRELLDRNIKRFAESVDFTDLKVIVQDDNNLLFKLGYSQMQISKAEHIYLLSERGYSKLIKIMDTDLAWEIHDRLVDEYFELREKDKKPAAPKPKNLSAINMMVKNMSGLLEKAGVDPLFIVAESKRIYGEAGYTINIPLITDSTMPKLYDCTEIAKELGILSLKGNPHNQAVSAIIKQLSVSADEMITTAFSRNGHEDVTTQYKPSVFNKVKAWLDANNYPARISNGIKAFAVVYKEAA